MRRSDGVTQIESTTGAFLKISTRTTGSVRAYTTRSTTDAFPSGCFLNESTTVVGPLDIPVSLTPLAAPARCFKTSGPGWPRRACQRLASAFLSFLDVQELNLWRRIAKPICHEVLTICNIVKSQKLKLSA
ncbi:hypothetical protein TMatcc_009100 [Talaromyces marneffei ATCC 18224]